MNALSPGPIETPIFGRTFTAEAIEGIKKSQIEHNPMKRMGTSEEMAKAALFLASSDSSYVTGIDLKADGGLGQI